MVEGRPSLREETYRRQQEIPETEVERNFFSGMVVDRARFEADHPFGLEVAPVATVERRRKQAQSLFQQIRQSKWGKPLMGLMGVLAGVGPLVFERMQNRESLSKDETVEVANDDPGVQYEMKRLVLEELIASGEMTVEQEGRFGRQRWDQLRRLAYQDFPTLTSKFEYLHDDQPDIIAAYGDPRGRLDNYRSLYIMMVSEFKHSSLPYQFSDQCIEDAVTLIPSLPQSEALTVYNSFSQELMQTIGFRAVREMALGLAQSLPAEHPVMQQIKKHAWLSDEAAGWLKPQKENSSYFDQVTGRVRIYHNIGDQMILLDTFPGNGGPADGVAWERGLPAQVAVRTPDGEFNFSRAFEKKSASWQYSWVTDTSPLRFTQDKQNVEYQDEDGKWRRLTGEEGEFTVMGAPQKPFKEKKKSSLYNAATDRTGESAVYPAPFDTSDVIGEDGNLRATWDLNDFGPRSIQMKDQQGKAMSIFFHSSPKDEGAQVFLDNSHGCIHMKPIDLDVMSSYLDRGSKMRISSVEIDTTKLSQNEKRGVSALTEG
ncbi:MAG: L,D-transpeptidase [Patescibacteria group bacterium]